MILMRHQNQLSLWQSDTPPVPHALYLAAGSSAWTSDLALAQTLEKTIPASLSEAIQDASKWHHLQQYGTVPYILHCWEVAHAVEQYVENPTLAQRIAAWHHDLFEDTDYPLDYHQHRYGEETTRLVQACTGVGSNRRDRQLAIHHQLLQQPQAIDIKLADRAINMRHSLHNARLWKMYQAELPAWDELLAHSNSTKMIAFFQRSAQNAPESNYGGTPSISLP